MDSQINNPVRCFTLRKPNRSNNLGRSPSLMASVRWMRAYAISIGFALMGRL